MTTVALWPRGGRFASTSLLGKPVWQRTLDATRSLKPRRVLWVGKAPPDGMKSVSGRGLESIRDTVLFVPAELPCLGTSALRRLLKASRNSPAALYRSSGGSPLVLAADARAVRTAAHRTLPGLLRKVRANPVFPGDDEDLLLVDTAENWSHAHRVLRTRKAASLLRRGVLIPEPTNVYVDPEVTVGAGTLLSPWIVLEGDSHIGKGCVIGSFSHLVNTTVGSDTEILDHCFIRESRIGKAASIGPFTHMRPASDVGDSARVGNFVELKKAKLGAGVKAPHLSYVGDAAIGRGANIGAGTITCNYDGNVKSRTVVGDGAFIGSDVQLVAPVRVGKGAYVAAGSCIVNDVPAHALALARSRQIVKKGWAKARRRER